MRLNAKVDGNHPEIVKSLRDLGATVLSIAAVGKGAPDIIVGWRGKNYMFEIKEKNGKLNEIQKKFHDLWGGEIHTIFSIDDALSVISHS